MTGARGTRELNTPSTPILATLDKQLTITSANERGRRLVGKSVYELVPSSHHGLLDRARRGLFERRRLVAREIPSIAPAGVECRWWLVRAAPLSDAGRVVAAIAQAVPCDEQVALECPPVGTEVWQRELALHELSSVLRCLGVESLLSLGPCSGVWEPTE